MRAFALTIAISVWVTGTPFAAERETVAYIAKLANQNVPEIKSFLIGVAKVITGANAILYIEKRSTFFCPPEKMSLVTDEYLEILNSYLTRHPSDGAEDGAFIDIVFAKAFIEAFPC